jgi:hypothetical protein
MNNSSLTWAGLVAVCVPGCVGAMETTPTPVFNGLSLPAPLVAAACLEASAHYPTVRDLRFTGVKLVVVESPGEPPALFGLQCVYADHNGVNLQGFIMELRHPPNRSAESIRQFVLSRSGKLYDGE